MARLTPALTFIGLLTVGACSSSPSYKAPEEGDSDYLKGVDSRSEELYIAANAPAGGRDIRDIYISPVNLSQMAVIQPEGASHDESWNVDDIEAANLQAAVEQEFSQALSHDSAYNIVESTEQAEITLNTTIVAIHPNVTRSELDAGAKPGGAITMSVSIRAVDTGAVLIRTVDTKSTDNIWAFNNIEGSDPAINLIFRSWGNTVRRGLLKMQGRSQDPLAPTVILETQ